MFDIGLGELLTIGVVALVVLGPDRLPRAAAQAGRVLRQIRAQAAAARAQLDDALGPELTDLARMGRDLDPRRALFAEGRDLEQALTDTPSAGSSPANPPATAAEGEARPRPSVDPDLI